MSSENPDAVSDVLDRYFGRFEEIERIRWLCIEGFRQLEGTPRLHAAISNFRKARGTPLARVEALERATQQKADFVTRERTQGYPTLNAHTLVALWSALEAMVEDLVVARLSQEPKLRASEPLSKIRVPLGEFVSLSLDEQLQLLVRELARSTNADLRSGVNRFEALLNSVGLSGPVSETVRETLFELNQVRNVLVHRAGFADKKLGDACRAYRQFVGKHIAISNEEYAEFSSAVADYTVELIVRLLVVEFGVPRAEALREVGARKAEEGQNPADDRPPGE